MLLRLWADQPYRATRDLDLLRRGDGAFEAVREDLRAILAAPVPLDAVSFDADDIQVEAIRAEDEYAGVREIPWTRLGRISDEEMKVLMIDIVNKTYTFLRYLEELAAESAQTRHWDRPKLDQDLMISVRHRRAVRRSPR